MSTLNSLQSDIDALNRRISTLEEILSSHGTSIKNIQTIVDQHTTTLNTHETHPNNNKVQSAEPERKIHLGPTLTLRL